jgi:predicted nucleotidyltransferase
MIKLNNTQVNKMKKIEKVKKILAEHRDELRHEYKIIKIGIFGSYIKGEQKKKSDLDILVEFNEPVSLLDWIGAENYLTDLLGIKVDLVPKEDVRPELKKRILKEVVYV